VGGNPRSDPMTRIRGLPETGGCPARPRLCIAKTPFCCNKGLSVPTSTVPSVESDDVVDPGDAAVQALLALTAEITPDDEKREKLLDAILTIPPLTEWPSECREKLWETCQFVISLWSSKSCAQTDGPRLTSPPRPGTSVLCTAVSRGETGVTLDRLHHRIFRGPAARSVVHPL
jgi:hypothetical protein